MEDLHDSDDNLNDIDDLDAEPGWILARDRCSVALIRRLISRQNADDLGRRVIRHIRAEEHPELSDMHHYTWAGATRCTNRFFRNNGVKELPKRTAASACDVSMSCTRSELDRGETNV